ncbi:hypothetical protein Btru_007630 [Bulinus truncatus]|nr:hypothetical protein Btru_007630 [Bulinus truncatus]
MLRSQEEVLAMDPETYSCTPKQTLEKPPQRRLFGSDLVSSSSDEDVTASRMVQGVIKTLETHSPNGRVSYQPNKEQVVSTPERCDGLYKNLELSSRKKSLSLKSPNRQLKCLTENKFSHVTNHEPTSEQSSKKTLEPLSPQDLNAGSLQFSPSSSHTVKVNTKNSLKGFQLNPSVGSLSTLFCNGIADHHSLCQTDLVQKNKSEGETLTTNSKPRKSSRAPSFVTHKDSHDVEMAKNINVDSELQLPHAADGPLRPKLTRKKQLFSGQQSNAFHFDASKQDNEENLSNRLISSRKKMDDSLASARADASFLFSIGCPENSSSQDNTLTKKTSFLQKSSKNSKHKVRRDKNLSDENSSQESSCSEMIPSSCTQDDCAKNLLESSMSVMYPSDTSHVNPHPGRRRSTRLSMNEFSFKNSQPKKMDNSKRKIFSKEVKAKATSPINNSAGKVKKQSEIKRKRGRSSSNGRQSNEKNKKRKKSDSSTSEGNAQCKLNNSSAADVEEGTSAKLRHARSLIIAKQDLICQKEKYSLVMTSLHRNEQDIVCSVVKKFGIFRMTNYVQPCTTHVVCGDARRTLNILRAIARGCWVLRKSWAFESLEAGCWLLEENYEMEKEFPAARRSRLEREKVGHGYKPDLLSKVGPICVFSDCTPPREELVHLINLCCGHVTGSQTRASVFIGNNHDPKRLVISPTWILDCITSLETLNQLDYIVPAPVSQRENSPEF